jgi:hypothetical protein
MSSEPSTLRGKAKYPMRPINATAYDGPLGSRVRLGFVSDGRIIIVILNVSANPGETAEATIESSRFSSS